MSERPSPPAGGPETQISDWTLSQGRTVATAQAPENGFTPGTILAARYRIVSVLARGGMGEVYRADDLKLGHPVALKFFPRPLGRDAMNRLTSEVRIGRQVAHPSVCRIYDLLESDGHTFLAMEYVDGEDLASLVSRIGRLPHAKALEIARDVALGLAALHDKGIVHRDLKPANVMIDGRGRARLTDLGLAVALETPGQLAYAGTPAYMAPEQLFGGEITPRTDLYALGLVLFEMLTGARFFDARTLEELQDQHRQSLATRLTRSGVALEATDSRLVAACLQPSAEQRPPSARALVAQMPGASDPLDAAVAAGETPSPEMVAAAGRVGDLPVGAAWASLAAALAGLALSAALSDRVSLVSRTTVPRSEAWLRDRAHDVLAATAPGAATRHQASWLAWDQDLFEHVRRGSGADGWARVRRGDEDPALYVLRTSPGRLVPQNRDGVVRMDDPPHDVSGMAEVVLDARGRLRSLVVVPPQVEPAPSAAAPLDWAPVLRLAGLDPSAFRVVPPRWAAPVDSDAKVAWDGVRPGTTEPLHVEAASYHGRPVWFATVMPWTRAARTMPREAQGPPTPIGGLALVLVALSMPLGGFLLARRNLQLGRGDRRSAFRVGIFVFASYASARLFRADHVASFGDELWVVIKMLAYPALWGALVWVLYLALEPYVRRRWPHVLISWKRLLSGEWRDPMVGRDLLLGATTGIAVLALYLLTLAGPAWLGLGPSGAPALDPAVLGSTRHVMFRILVNQYSAVLFGLVFLFVLVLLRMLLRHPVAAALAWCLLLSGPMGGEDPILGWIGGLLRTVLMLTVLTRLGFLALVTMLFFLFAGAEAVLTLDVGAWYAASGVPVVLVFGAIVVGAFVTSLGGKPALGSLPDD